VETVEIDQNIMIQAPANGDNFVQLARSSKGKVFRKQILPMGSFIHPSAPNTKINVDEQFAQSLVDNFKAGHCGIVQVPIVDDMNKHVEDPMRNSGEVIDLSYDDSGVYATIDARKHADDFGSTLLGASALMNLDYKDTKDGERHGPALLHVAVTNRPYLDNLSDFEELAALSADTSDEAPVALIPATDSGDNDMPMTKDEMIAALSAEHGIDVTALQTAAATGSGELVAALGAVLKSAGSTVALSAGGTDEITVKDVADAVIELANERVELSGQVGTLIEANEALVKKEAAAEIDSLIQAGRILPKQRNAMIALSMDDRETFDALLPDDSIVALSETGITTYDEPADATKRADDIARLSEIANRSTTGKK
jgi:hypothetical protein